MQQLASSTALTLAAYAIYKSQHSTLTQQSNRCLLSGVHAQASPISCVPTVTVTTRPGTSDGCKFNCSSDFCIIDSVVTQTVTACATSTPCWNCHTGFPFTTTATDCP
ncbi:hypothetical protein M419DRAFT_5414 [Trichoderma reesei RUT C-30]|uniref:Uncharacterized protein n=1 Tax=Hypocrea jecorina (strain ATCC 56765 / BCRC 32924 / NRRL 11460 / Rut C-30) TaxID=1344414 RepID=A0A024SNG9_HYPJR|nr:hypothetical protein M419DRAFT_5414 [Trichoderma reesei RUT C-30]